MSLHLRIKLIGEENELNFIRKILSKNLTSFSEFRDLDEACDNQISDPADIFVLGGSHYYQSSLNQIHKLKPEPEVILSSEEKIPNLAKILAPNFISSDLTENEVYWNLEHSSDLAKKKRRLGALRDHHNRSLSQESNPAINLVTNLMSKCTIAEDFQIF